jgi:hypothetical protein
MAVTADDLNGLPREELAPVKMSQAELLVKIADLAEVFRGPDGETAYATVNTNGHRETWPVKSSGFKRWLKGQFYAAEGKPPGGQAFADAIGVIDARALYTTIVLPVHTRVAATATETVYLDLANTKWQAVEITGTGWRIVDDPPVKFRRSRGMLSLPLPTADGRVDDLREFVNIGDDAQWKLLVGWLLATLRGTGPFPVLALGGEHGSAKSTTARVLRSLVDPNQAMLRAEPREVRDVMISARNGWVVALDNLSSIESWLSDCLCRLATGGGFSTRELYSDDDEIIFDAKRPVTINGIEEVIERADLLDRALLLDLPVIAEQTRRSERDFWMAFDAARPSLLGALLTVVSAGLGRESSVKLAKLPRMADFCIQVTASAPALGWGDEDFLAAYTGNREGANESALDNSSVATAVRTLLADLESWSGTASELLGVLDGRVEEATRREKWWPKTPKTLAGHLRRLGPNLRAVGVDLQFVRDPDKKRSRRITINQTERGTVRPVRPNSPNPRQAVDPSDAANALAALSDAPSDAAEAVDSGVQTDTSDASDTADAQVPYFLTPTPRRRPCDPGCPGCRTPSPRGDSETGRGCATGSSSQQGEAGRVGGPPPVQARGPRLARPGAIAARARLFAHKYLQESARSLDPVGSCRRSSARSP